jgi:hypothetical protein
MDMQVGGGEIAGNKIRYVHAGRPLQQQIKETRDPVLSCCPQPPKSTTR